jgi:hypothetical protein
MKTKFMLSAAIVAALNCATLNAQVIGGGAVGGLGGSVGGRLGGMRDIAVAGQGAGHGSLVADHDARSLRHATGDLTGRATRRARDTVKLTRDRAGSTSVLGTKTGVATTTRQVNTTANAAANAAADVGVADAATARHDPKIAARSLPGVDSNAASELAGGGSSALGEMKLPSRQERDEDGRQASLPSPSLEGALSESAIADASGDDKRLSLATSGDASAQGNAAASKETGVSARGSAQGSASASLGK